MAKYGKVKRQPGRVTGLDEILDRIVRDCPHVTRIIPGRRGRNRGKMPGGLKIPSATRPGRAPAVPGSDSRLTSPARSALINSVSGSAWMNGCRKSGNRSDEKKIPDISHIGSMTKFISPEMVSIRLARQAVSSPSPQNDSPPTNATTISDSRPPVTGTPKHRNAPAGRNNTPGKKDVAQPPPAAHRAFILQMAFPMIADSFTLDARRGSIDRRTRHLPRRQMSLPFEHQIPMLAGRGKVM